MEVQTGTRKWSWITLLVISAVVITTFFLPAPPSAPPPNVGVYINRKENHITTLCGMSVSEVKEIRHHLERMSYSEAQKLNLKVKEGDTLKVKDSSFGEYILRKVAGVRIGIIRWAKCGHMVGYRD